jgi:hypothetical protein
VRVPSTAILHAAAGVAVSVVCWLVLVPWDLSTADADGRVRRDFEEPLAEIIVVLAIPVALCAASIRYTTRGCVARSVAVVGTWSVLLTWRSMVADVVGANMWLAGLAVVTIPASCVALAVLLTLCAWFRRLAVSR